MSTVMTAAMTATVAATMPAATTAATTAMIAMTTAPTAAPTRALLSPPRALNAEADCFCAPPLAGERQRSQYGLPLGQLCGVGRSRCHAGHAEGPAERLPAARAAGSRFVSSRVAKRT